ncbi:hypothetical protein D3C87_1406970 [compost metagenome]
MTHHGDDLGVHQLLGHGGAGLRIGGVIFTHQLQLDLLAADFQTGLVDFFHGQAGAVFVVLAKVGNAARQRSRVTDLDDGFTATCSRRRRGRCRCCRISRLFFFLATCSDQRHSGRDRQNLGKRELHE